MNRSYNHISTVNMLLIAASMLKMLYAWKVSNLSLNSDSDQAQFAQNILKSMLAGLAGYTIFC